jgi:hypothetical protein
LFSAGLSRQRKLRFDAAMRLHQKRPWRKKPADYLRYWTGKPDRRGSVKTILVYCLGGPGQKCGHHAKLKIADLPDWSWYDISAHLRCTECGAVGYVDTRPDWPPVPMGVNAR